MKLIAKGNTAEIYEYGNNLVCKLFYSHYPAEYIEHEFRNAAMAWTLGIRTPRAHKLVMEGDRQGIVYDRIPGEMLSQKMAGQSEPVCNMWMDRFVGFHKQLLQHRADDAVSYKDFLKVLATDIVLIDMMNVCKSPALYDVARTYFLLHDNSRIQSQYLAKMRYSVKNIRPYLDVIQMIRD